MAIKFSDMSEYQRRQVYAWAASHDWGGNEPRWGDGEALGYLLVSCWVSERDGRGYIEPARFDNMSDLRDWAGY